MSLTLYLLLYCVLIIAASLLGGWIPLHVRLTHARLQLANSLIGGFMLGIALLHLLPHALMFTGNPQHVMYWMVGGLLTMFLLERVFHYHQHDLPSHPPSVHDHAHAAGASAPPNDHDDCDHNHGHHHDHSHHPHADDETSPKPLEDCDETTDQHPHYERKVGLSWGGAAIGLVLHSLIGGVGLGAAMVADEQLHAEGALFWPGLAIFLVIVLHKPFDAMTLLALVTTSGGSRKAGHLINAAFSLAVPLGAALFMVGLANTDMTHSPIVANGLGFAAGVFLCIALSDVLPELHFHRHDAAKLTAALLVGLALAWAINHFEMKHHDDIHGGPSPTGVPHDHDGDGVPDH